MCRDKYTRDADCMCCPIRMGVVIMAWFIIILGFLLIIDTILYFFNQYYESWYGLIGLLLLLPYFTGVIFLFMWLADDSVPNRKRLPLAGWLALSSVVALYIWTVFYMYNVNRGKYVYVGTGDKND